MNAEQRALRTRIRAVLAGYAIGLGGVVAGVAIWDSRAMVGLSLVWLTLVVGYAWLGFRCPLCNESVFNGPARAALLWLFRTPRRCPRCRTDYDVALAELRDKERQGRG